MPEPKPINGAQSGAKQQRANPPEAQGQPAEQGLTDGAVPSAAHDDDFEPLPPPQVRRNRGPGLPCM